MSDLKIFFNTRIENAGFLSTVGNAGLLPLQYLKYRCDGDKVTIATVSGHKVTMTSYFSGNWRDAFCTRMLKTLAAVALLVPGLLLSLFKLAAYASSDVRKTHALVKETMAVANDPARRPRIIGSKEAPIKTIDALKAELQKAAEHAEAQNFPDNLTGALIIYGDGALKIKEDPGILRLDPRRLILIGAELIHGPSAQGCLDDLLRDTCEWEQGVGMRMMKADHTRDGRTVSKKGEDSSLSQQNGVATLDEALQAPSEMSGGRPLRMIYTVTGISLDDVESIEVDETCYAKIGKDSAICEHACTVSLKNGQKASQLSPYEIAAILRLIPQGKIAAKKNWGPTDIKKHFYDYKCQDANVVLNALHFAKASS